jgi:hypothetical protein
VETWVWLIVIGVAAVGLFGLVWWTSGRARPLGRSSPDPFASEVEHAKFMSQNRSDFGAGGPG